MRALKSRPLVALVSCVHLRAQAGATPSEKQAKKQLVLCRTRLLCVLHQLADPSRQEGGLSPPGFALSLLKKPQALSCGPSGRHTHENRLVFFTWPGEDKPRRSWSVLSRRAGTAPDGARRLNGAHDDFNHAIHRQPQPVGSVSFLARRLPILGHVRVLRSRRPRTGRPGKIRLPHPFNLALAKSAFSVFTMYTACRKCVM